MMPEAAANGQFRGPIDILVPFTMKAAVTDRSRELRRHELAVGDHEGRVASLEQAAKDVPIPRRSHGHHSRRTSAS